MPIEKAITTLKTHLLANSGIQGLEILKPTEIERAVGLFDRDGFVVIEDVLSTDELALLQSGVADAVAEITALDPEGLGNRGAKRYSFGGSSLTRSQLHRPAWQMLLSVEPVIQLLDAIFGNPDYALRSASGDFCLPGAVDYQRLHTDVRDWEAPDKTPFSAFHDPRGRVSIRDLPCPYVCEPGTAENNYQGTGGQLKPGYESVYADYLLRYLDAYAAAGVPIWGLTPVNEPEGNSGQWESMHFTAEGQARFIQDHLGPKLQASAHAETKLLIFDQNRDRLEHWADTILSQPDVAQYVYGSAIHWYASTTNVYGDVLERVHTRFPEFDLIHTEGTIDDLGKPAPGGIGDPAGFTETNWFNNDAFWWQRKATDWAYTASWAPNAADHPMYTPVHRYARNIIGSLNHWVSGWVDWNPVLDERGGPNHVGNFCGAPIMVNLETQDVYFTPIFDVLSQFSRTIRPGDQAVTVSIQGDAWPEDALHVGATLSPKGLISIQLLNTQMTPLTFGLGLLGQHAVITLPANALQTIRVDLSAALSETT